MGRNSLEDEISFVIKNLELVDENLPGMEDFTSDQLRTIIRMICDLDIVNDISCLGWSFWPYENKGYYDENLLDTISKFIRIQNKPFWDDYYKWCEEIEKENIDEFSTKTYES